MEELFEKYNQHHYQNQDSGDEMDLLYRLTEADQIQPDVEEGWSRVRKEIKPVQGRPMMWRIAAIIALVMGLAVVYNYVDFSEKIPLQVINGPETLMLDDGTEIKLGHHTQVRFDVAEPRKVMLSGQAFFDVVKGNRPFEIVVDGSLIQVLGTEFLVTEGRQNLRVQVVEGTVRLVHDDESITIEAGQEGMRHNKSEVLTYNEEPDMNRLSLVTNEFEFDNTPMRVVVNHLNRHYDSHIVLNSKELKECTLTGTFKDQELREILNAVQAVLDIRIEYKDNRILLKGKGC